MRSLWEGLLWNPGNDHTLNITDLLRYTTAVSEWERVLERGVSSPPQYHNRGKKKNNAFFLSCKIFCYCSDENLHVLETILSQSSCSVATLSKQIK